MNARELLPRPWFSVDDLKEPLTVKTIPGDPITIKELNKEDKPVVKMLNQNKYLIMNREHRDFLIEKFGDETQGWGDKELVLYSEPGSRGVKIRLPEKQAQIGNETVTQNQNQAVESNSSTAQNEKINPSPKNEEVPSGTAS